MKKELEKAASAMWDRIEMINVDIAAAENRFREARAFYTYSIEVNTYHVSWDRYDSGWKILILDRSGGYVSTLTEAPARLRALAWTQLPRLESGLFESIIEETKRIDDALKGKMSRSSSPSAFPRDVTWDEAAWTAAISVVNDLQDRGGLRQAWDNVPNRIRDEIVTAWAKRISDAMKDHKR